MGRSPTPWLRAVRAPFLLASLLPGLLGLAWASHRGLELDPHDPLGAHDPHRRDRGEPLGHGALR
ncbi:hypothetical protein [Thioalkalivibrio sulfidiphilus]|uniref:hypothetical protein n=1 Tax=Thioalkalivibrio sulfidiphilus TaxID=1033854 RepID=UPI0003A3C118|nr:hypothetical protein [Thioalkalivibrio sulfidiphilus]